MCTKYRICLTPCLALWSASLFAGLNQTEDFSPVLGPEALPYRIELRPLDLTAELPTLHSFAKAQWDGKWLLMTGRTNGLHGFLQNGFANFPPAFANREVWVIDPVNDASWHRSLNDPETQLTVAEVDSLSVTNNQFHQSGSKLYMTGGYGFLTDVDFVTFDLLTAVDVPGLIGWVQGNNAWTTETIRQIRDPMFTVTGGAMHAIGDTTHLVFGQDFQGGYTFFGDGEYTHQVRSFRIVDDGVSLSVADATSSTPDPAYRRRDLNVIPVVRRRDGVLHQELVALSGVFTLEGGGWTVPVEIAADGSPSMADPEDPGTFKQAMNAYHSAKLGLFSEATGEMHTILFGGISGHWVDRDTGELVRDDQLPFINQLTSVVIDETGSYRQHLLDEEFPAVYDAENGRRIRYGTNADFFLADGIETYENGVLQLDVLTEPTTVGYIYGGIAADRDHRGNTVASGTIFAVDYVPIPEPSALWLVALALGACSARRVCRAAGAGSSPARDGHGRV